MSRTVAIVTMGCARNEVDSEELAGRLAADGWTLVEDVESAEVAVVNTCGFIESAKKDSVDALLEANSLKGHGTTRAVVAVGCMAERLKTKFLEEEKMVDLVVGPDAYRDLPNLVREVESGKDAISVILSKEETYGDVTPVRLNSNGVSAFISITRGCDNMCTFCVVPFTRGRERSRDPQSILEEAQDLWEKGYKEITLLGQNVNAYGVEFCDRGAFAKLLREAGKIEGLERVRFMSPHPRDFTDDVIDAYIALKMQEVTRLRMTTHPIEFDMYYSL